jgi:carboxylesterase
MSDARRPIDPVVIPNGDPFEEAQARRFTIGAEGIVVGAEAIAHRGAQRRAALLVHGFNDTPQSMAYLAAAIHHAGWTVLAPRLSGHGVALRRMALEARADRWRSELLEHHDELRRTHDHVVVCGQSMGGALAVLLAIDRPTIDALVLLAPYIGMPRRLRMQLAIARMLQPESRYRASSGGERSLHDPDAKARALGPGVITARTMTELQTVAMAAEQALGRLAVPTLYLQSREDNRIAPGVAERSFQAIGSQDKVQRWVSGCGHIISADYCRDEVARQVIEWYLEHCRPAAVDCQEQPSTIDGNNNNNNNREKASTDTNG